MKNKKLYNYILVGIFLSVLYLPTILFFFFRNTDMVSDKENRVLANQPVLSLKNIETYPKDYEKFFNDNLPFRDELISSWRTLNYLLFDDSIEPNVLVGHDNNNEKWLFYNNRTSGDPISYIDGRKVYSDKEMEDFVTKDKTQTELMKKQNIDLYYLIVPNKSTIYNEYLPKSVTVNEDAFNKVYKYMKKNKISNVYYPYDLLMKEKNKDVANHELYFRTDTHWNKYGALIVWKNLLNDIYPKNKFHYNKDTDFSYQNTSKGDLHKFLNINVPIKDNNFEPKYNSDVINRWEDKIGDDKVVVITNNKYEINETILLIGDSYSINSSEILKNMYKKIIWIDTNISNYNEEILKKYNPSKIFFVNVERDSADNFNINLKKS